jgi:hypothetical protein
MSNFSKDIWKYGIIAACVGFASLMISFGIMASHNHIDLVVRDYYKEEINYQKQINKEGNYKALIIKPIVIVDSLRKNVAIRFPDLVKGGEVKGRLMFYRPDNQKYDDTIALQLDGTGCSNISLEKYRKGRWKMRMEWMHNDTPCLVQQSFNLLK